MSSNDSVDKLNVHGTKRYAGDCRRNRRSRAGSHSLGNARECENHAVGLPLWAKKCKSALAFFTSELVKGESCGHRGLVAKGVEPGGRGICRLFEKEHGSGECRKLDCMGCESQEHKSCARKKDCIVH